MSSRIRTLAMAAIVAIAGLATVGGAATSAHGSGLAHRYQAAVEQMMTPKYMRAVNKGSFVLSYYKKCDLPFYEPELMASRASNSGPSTSAQDWKIVGRCNISYEGESSPCFGLHKDELGGGASSGRVVQYGKKICRYNELFVKTFTSKPGYFTTLPPTCVNDRHILDYYSNGKGVWVPNPDGSMAFRGKYQLNTVDCNHAVCAYGVWWTSGYLLGARDFTVVSNYAFLNKVRCVGSNVTYPHG